jgi:hypothetical protein
MHDHWFDTVVRTLPRRVERRAMLRSGVAAIAAGVLAMLRHGDTGAYHSHIPLGGTCRHTRQCLHHELGFRFGGRSRQAVVCAYNGFHYDGPHNCCRHLGGFCERDEHCCGARHFCRNRVCTYLA